MGVCTGKPLNVGGSRGRSGDRHGALVLSEAAKKQDKSRGMRVTVQGSQLGSYLALRRGGGETAVAVGSTAAVYTPTASTQLARAQKRRAGSKA